MSEWIDLQLSHQMAEVKAPDELWTRIQAGPRPRRVVPRIALATAALVTVIAVAYSSAKPRELPRVATFHSDTCTACHTM